MKTLFPAVVVVTTAMLTLDGTRVLAVEGLTEARMHEASWTEPRATGQFLMEVPPGKSQNRLMPNRVPLDPLVQRARLLAATGKPLVFPIVVTLEDKEGRPVTGAIVALKRLGPDNFTEEEVRRDAEDKPRTDENGTILLQYPGVPEYHEDGPLLVEMLGGVTILAEGHKPQVVELKDFFTDGKHVLSSKSAPQVKVSLGE